MSASSKALLEQSLRIYEQNDDWLSALGILKKLTKYNHKVALKVFAPRGATDLHYFEQFSALQWPSDEQLKKYSKDGTKLFNLGLAAMLGLATARNIPLANQLFDLAQKAFATQVKDVKKTSEDYYPDATTLGDDFFTPGLLPIVVRHSEGRPHWQLYRHYVWRNHQVELDPKIIAQPLFEQIRTSELDLFDKDPRVLFKMPKIVNDFFQALVTDDIEPLRKLFKSSPQAVYDLVANFFKTSMASAWLMLWVIDELDVYTAVRDCIAANAHKEKEYSLLRCARWQNDEFFHTVFHKLYTPTTLKRAIKSPFIIDDLLYSMIWDIRRQSHNKLHTILKTEVYQQPKAIKKACENLFSDSARGQILNGFYCEGSSHPFRYVEEGHKYAYVLNDIHIKALAIVLSYCPITEYDYCKAILAKTIFAEVPELTYSELKDMIPLMCPQGVEGIAALAEDLRAERLSSTALDDAEALQWFAKTAGPECCGPRLLASIERMGLEKALNLFYQHAPRETRTATLDWILDSVLLPNAQSLTATTLIEYYRQNSCFSFFSARLKDYEQGLLHTSDNPLSTENLIAELRGKAEGTFTEGEIKPGLSALLLATLRVKPKPEAIIEQEYSDVRPSLPST